MAAERARIAFLLLCAASLSIALGYIVWTTPRSTPSDGVDATRVEASDPSGASTVEPPAEGGEPGSTDVKVLKEASEPVPIRTPSASWQMLFRDTSLGANHGRLVSEWVDGASSRGQLTPLRCERVHFASGRGVCLTAERGFTTTYGAAVFDSEFRILSQFPLAGVPSRVRVSPDGHRAAITVFVSGDSYAPGSFSTRTTVLDTLTGESLFDLEQMHVERDGAPFKAIDFNFWGVTFESAARFYATLATGGRIYLVVGNVDTRQATVMRETVECPSLSPDGTRVAFKKRTQSGGRLAWRIHVMDLVTGAETPLGETRSVDDQVEWVDAARVAYGLPSESRPESTDVWTVPADGTGAPSLLRAGAWSPVVVRQAAVFEP